MTSKLVLMLILIALLKISYNIYCFLLCKLYYKKYVEFVKGSKSWFVKEHRQQIIKLFEKVGIEDAFQPSTEQTGYGMLATSNFSVFRNMTVLREDIMTIINSNFREAQGVYKQRVFEAFNPIYWVETFLQLPKLILVYLGIKPKDTIVKFFQVLWWIIVAISVIIGIVFNKEFMTWTRQFV